eukprot:CAMPEP_0202915782 /NCGR_PEP_ID=MMETSP1392-20130828/66655_1 /ASSEMBLY_ACC=CAM_ASM_000868 /TAXON_ID=225041 /ORGANISM="Chlamydomonas chlamydogama, Strain SAG 11-48b" /LENGTH=196 /DNA_ID=CAMNT_0049607955 /DNA_START=1 /DNA_END=587 /DNA_ORIENTATION=+
MLSRAGLAYVLFLVLFSWNPAVEGCTDAADACGQEYCQSCNYDSCPCSGIGSVSDCSSAICSTCNIFGCDCDPCPACSTYCPAPEHLRLKRALLQQTPSNSSSFHTRARKKKSCKSLATFLVTKPRAVYLAVSRFWCKQQGEYVGWDFFGHLMELLDNNQDGQISCDEWRLRTRDLSLVKKPPRCMHRMPAVFNQT